MKLKLALLVSLIEMMQEQATEQTGQDSNR
jgi:hypothetical protein